MQDKFASRRNFCCSIAGLAATVIALRLPFGIGQRRKMLATDQHFLIVNGWVLTREDIAASGATLSDAV